MTSPRLGRVAVVVGAVLLVAAPWLLRSPTNIDRASQVLAFAVALAGLDVVMGYSGQISIGHSAFVGVGAYTTVILVADHGANYYVTMPLAFAICFAVGVAVGLPALRIQGLYLAAVTLAIAVLFPIAVIRFDGLTGGHAGKQANDLVMPPSWFPLDADSRFGPPAFRYLTLVVVAAIMFTLGRNLLRSRIGRALVAIRESPVSAVTSGIPVSRYKVLAFGVSAGFAGVAGSMLMVQLPLATENRFGLDFAILLLVALVVGGIGSFWGAIPGAIVLLVIRTYIPKWTDSIGLFEGRPGAGEMAGVISGVMLLVVVFVMPGGVAEAIRRVVNRNSAARRPTGGLGALLDTVSRDGSRSSNHLPSGTTASTTQGVNT